MGLFFKKPTAAELIAKGSALLKRGQIDAAFEAMKAAAVADPAAAAPLAWMADIAARKMLTASDADAQQLYVQANELAREALERDSNEDRATAVLGRLARLRQPPAREAGPDAVRALQAGNEHFGMGRFEAARRAYEAASRADPGLAEAVKLGGNCHFATRDYRAAEQMFRRAIELDPLEPQAHHFLADAHLAQSRPHDAMAAATASIAANPAYYPAWQVVRALRESQGRPLRRCCIRPLAFAYMADDGKPSIEISNRVSSDEEAAAWAVYASARHGLVASGVDEPPSALAAELRGLRAAIEIARADNTQRCTSDSLLVLRQLGAMDEHGELPTAALLLAYDESYRDDLEALKREHPDVAGDFLDRHGLRPF